MATQKLEFEMEMTCEGCSNAAKRVLNRIGVTDVTADLATQKITVITDKPAKEVLAALEKTGKPVKQISP